METILKVLFKGAIAIAVILFVVWNYFAPARAENEARINAPILAGELCNESLRASVLENTKNTTPGFIALETATLSTTPIDEGYVVNSAAYVRTLRQPNSHMQLAIGSSRQKPLYILSCHVVNGQILNYEWIK